MVILSKKRFGFKGPSPGVFFTTQGGMAIETAPDWIKNTWLYDLAAADGDIVELNVELKDNSGDAQVEAAVASAKAARTRKVVAK